MDKKFGKSETKGYWAGVSIKYERAGMDHDDDDEEEDPGEVTANDLMNVSK
jgi:hypothetical protein